MAQKQIPGYFGLRIYLISSVLFFMLVFPFMVYLGLQNLPRLANSSALFGQENGVPADSLSADTNSIGPLITDSIRHRTDSMIRKGHFDPIELEEVEKLAEVADNLDHKVLDSIADQHKHGNLIKIQEGEEQHSAFDNKGPFGRFFTWFFPLSILAYLAGLLYNWPFKRYFRRKRQKKSIPDPLYDRCRKHLLRTPFVNALIISFPNFVLIIYSFIFLVSGSEKINETENELFVYFFLLTLIASTLEFLFAYYWQRHRVHLKYLDHIFSEEELRERIFRRKMLIN